MSNFMLSDEDSINDVNPLSHAIFPFQGAWDRRAILRILQVFDLRRVSPSQSVASIVITVYARKHHPCVLYQGLFIQREISIQDLRDTISRLLIRLRLGLWRIPCFRYLVPYWFSLLLLCLYTTQDVKKVLQAFLVLTGLDDILQRFLTKIFNKLPLPSTFNINSRWLECGI